jgi:hypothetical protein
MINTLKLKTGDLSGAGVCGALPPFPISEELKLSPALVSVTHL